MQRLSLIISEVYNKFLPLAENSSVQLDLDFPDTTQQVINPAVLQAELEQHLNSALNRTKGGKDSKITLSVDKNQIRITDSGTILSKPICELMSGERVQVKSRLGFGTTVTIKLNSPKSDK